MKLQELQNQIINKQIENLYIFTGDEIAVQKIYINKISDVTKLDIEYVFNFKDIVNKLSSDNIFNTKKVYVILDDEDIVKQEKVWQDIQPNNNILIFKYNNLDKRTKFYKYFENKLVEFTKLSTNVLKSYIKRKINLNDINCDKLIEICGNSYNQILLELDKFINYENSKESIINYDIDFMFAEKLGLFHKEISDITFKFIDVVTLRDIKNTIVMMQDLKTIGESNIKLLSLLYTNFKTILLIQNCNSKDICKTTGLSYFQIKLNQDKVNIYSTAELLNAISVIQKAESDIKKGLLDEQLALDYVIVNIM